MLFMVVNLLGCTVKNFTISALYCCIKKYNIKHGTLIKIHTNHYFCRKKTSQEQETDLDFTLLHGHRKTPANIKRLMVKVNLKGEVSIRIRLGVHLSWWGLGEAAGEWMMPTC